MQTLQLLLEHFQCPQKKPCTISCHPPIHSALGVFPGLPLWVCLFWTFHMSRIIHYVVFGDQLLEHTGQLPAQGIKVWWFYLVVCLSAWPRHHPYHLCGSIPRLLQVPGLGLRETFPGHTIFNCNSHFTKLLFSLSALLCYTAYCYTVDLTYLSYES